jgi:hypothetical protein
MLRALALPLPELTEALLARSGLSRQMAALLAPSGDSMRVAQPRGLSSYGLRG